MRSPKRRVRLLLLLPVLGLATAGVAYMATINVPKTYAGVATFHVSCTSTPTVDCTTTRVP